MGLRSEILRLLGVLSWLKGRAILSNESLAQGRCQPLAPRDFSWDHVAILILSILKFSIFELILNIFAR